MSATLWNGFLAAVILVVANFLGTALSNLIRKNLARTGLDPEVRRLVAAAGRWGVVAIAAIPAMSQVGVEPSGIVAVLGAASLAVGLAMKSTLSNVASGAILLTLRPLREGDWVEAGGRQGTVTLLSLYTTTLRTGDGLTITLANDAVLSNPIVNYSLLGRRRFEVRFTLRHDSNPEAALSHLHDLLSQDDRTLDDPGPQTLIEDVSAIGTTVVGRAWTLPEDRLNTRTQVTILALRTFSDVGIQVARTSMVTP